MAALDYGMALARGLIAPQKELQAEVKKLAGDSFRTDEWWNKQLDRQIKAGFTETSRLGPTAFGGRGTFDYKVKQKGYDSATPIYEQRYVRRSRGGDAGRYLPITTPNVNPRAYFVQNNLIGYDATKTRGLNEAELKSIENQSKDTSKKIKSAARRSSKAEERKVRGTGGLMGRVKSNDRGLSAKLPELGGMGPELGSMGLGINKTFLG
jgi:hypothetical protein